MAVYKVQCKVCGSHFSVNSPNDKVPRHTPDGKILKASERTRPCRGSEATGSLIRESA